MCQVLYSDKVLQFLLALFSHASLDPDPHAGSVSRRVRGMHDVSEILGLAKAAQDKRREAEQVPDHPGGVGVAQHHHPHAGVVGAALAAFDDTLLCSASCQPWSHLAKSCRS